MISKPILLILAVLAACSAAQKDNELSREQSSELQYKRFLANGVDKKFVDEIRNNDQNYAKERAEAKGDPEKLKNASINHGEAYDEIVKKMSKDQFKKFHNSLDGY